MGKSKGGAPSTAGLEQATKESTALQKKIFELTREDVQPWYNMGTGAVSKLSDLLGIGGGSVQNREQIYERLKPQYTSQISSPSGTLIRDNTTGAVFDLASYQPEMGQTGGAQWASPELMMLKTQYEAGGNKITPELLSQYNFSQMGSPDTTNIDYEGLNAAVMKELGGQGTPDGYGSLLRRFGEQDMKDDEGYQFRQKEANKALERQMAAQGVTLGGAGFGELNPQAYRAVSELNQGLASQEYQNSYNRYVNDQLNTFNMLTGAAGMGQNATGIQSGAGQSYATNVGNLTTGMAQAQYQAAQANANKPSMFGQILGLGAQAAGAYFGGGGTLASLLGR